jgi:hypothetical protein
MQQYVNELLQIQQQLRVFHWQTKSYARHKAYGEAYESLADLIDQFVEVHMGKYGRFVLADETIEIRNLTDPALGEFLNGTTNFLISLSTQLDPKNDTDLLNIKDEMLAVVNKLKYLLTLA